MAKNIVKIEGKTFLVTDNILQNLVVRDSPSVAASFDEHYGSMLQEIDVVYSEAAFMFFVVTHTDTGLHDDYKSFFPGLVHHALNTFGAPVITLRNGLPAQSMVLIRQ